MDEGPPAGPHFYLNYLVEGHSQYSHILRPLVWLQHVNLGGHSSACNTVLETGLQTGIHSQWSIKHLRSLIFLLVSSIPLINRSQPLLCSPPANTTYSTRTTWVRCAEGDFQQWQSTNVMRLCHSDSEAWNVKCLLGEIGKYPMWTLYFHHNCVRNNYQNLVTGTPTWFEWHRERKKIAYQDSNSSVVSHYVCASSLVS